MIDRIRTGLIALGLGALIAGVVACGGGGATTAPPKSDAPAKTAPKSDAPAKTDAKAAVPPPSKVDSPPPGAARSPVAASPVAASPVAAPSGTSWINQELLPKAKQEGKVVWYTAAELAVSEAVAAAFEAAAGIPVEVVRSGGERLYSRIGQEQQANQFLVDVFLSSVEAHFLDYKDRNLLQTYKIMDDAKFTSQFKDSDGAYYTTVLAVTQPSYNPKIIPPDQAPKSWKDLLDPKFKGKIAISHPAYSGTTLAAMLALSQEFGWQYFEDLAKNDPLIVQSALEPIPLVISGERPVAGIGSGNQAITDKLKGNSIEPIYPVEGISVARLPSGILKNAPHPNAARVFMDFLHSQEAQQMWATRQNYISVRDDIKYPPGIKSLQDTKYFLLDGRFVESKREEVKDKFKDIFGS